MAEYRTGNHWGVTIVREGTQPPDASGKRPDAELVAVVVNGDQDLAERICALLNADGTEPFGAKRDWVADNSPQLAEWLSEQAVQRRAAGCAESCTRKHVHHARPIRSAPPAEEAP